MVVGFLWQGGIGVSGESLNGQLTRLVGELVHRGLSLDQARKAFERQFIVACLRRHGGNFSRSAECLGVHRNTLRNKLSTLGIDPSEYADAGPGKRRHRSRPSRS